MLSSRCWINDRFFLVYKTPLRITSQNIPPLDTDDRRKLTRIPHSSRHCAALNLWYQQSMHLGAYVCVLYVWNRLFFIPLRMSRTHCCDYVHVCVSTVNGVCCDSKQTMVAYLNRCVFNSHSYSTVAVSFQFWMEMFQSNDTNFQPEFYNYTFEIEWTNTILLRAAYRHIRRLFIWNICFFSTQIPRSRMQGCPNRNFDRFSLTEERSPDDLKWFKKPLILRGQWNWTMITIPLRK